MSHAFDRACPVHRVLIGATGCPECGKAHTPMGYGSPHGSTYQGEECPTDCPEHQT